MSKVLYKEYKRLFKKGNKKFTGYYVIYYMPNSQLKIKTAAKKKVGSAVKRNYERRVIKHIFKNVTFIKDYLIFVISIKPCPLNFEKKREHLCNHLSAIIKDNG